MRSPFSDVATGDPSCQGNHMRRRDATRILIFGHQRLRFAYGCISKIRQRNRIFRTAQKWSDLRANKHRDEIFACLIRDWNYTTALPILDFDSLPLIDPFHLVIYATVGILGFHDMFTKILEISWEWPPQPHAFSSSSMGVRWQLPAPALHARTGCLPKIIRSPLRNPRMSSQ